MREIACDRYLADDGPRSWCSSPAPAVAPARRPHATPTAATPGCSPTSRPTSPTPTRDSSAASTCARRASRARADPRRLRARAPRAARVPTRRPVRAARADRRRRPPLRAARGRHAGRAALAPRGPAAASAPPRRVSARDVVGALEDYEPVCALTRGAVARFRADRRVSVATLAVELRRVETSPIVLNRQLREAVLAAVRERGRQPQRDRDGVRARQARPARQRLRRDELARPARRAAAVGARHRDRTPGCTAPRSP